MFHALRFFLALALLSLHSAAWATLDNAYLAELQTRARQLKLAERPEWKKLLHYVPRLIAPGYKGQVDSPSFYFSAQGKTDAQAELDATLASFFSDTLESKNAQNPQCAFIARYTWLNSQLKFDSAQLTPRDCPRYRQWHASLNPAGLTLIFASAYLNSPSSMYGHTLLRVDAKDQDEHTRLLAYAVNFAANTNETNGLAFAVNGLFGGYAGAFSMLPYYAKVREYSDFENRDIWEYPLQLSAEEVDRVLMHVWELGPHYFDYFFFDENCSYHLLGLLQVARPEFEFTRDFPIGTIPADTVREIAATPALVSHTVYRPANATLLHHRLAAMSADERGVVHGISRGQAGVDAVAPMPAAQAAAVLETSLDYVSYRQATAHHDVADAGALARQLQQARSRLDYIAPPVVGHEPQVHPEQGHSSSRMTLGAGRRGARNFQELQLRATYHDLMDAEAGYVRGAEIEFFSMALRHYDFSPARIERVTPVNILSLAPRDEFFNAPSWKVSGGWQRVLAANGTEPLALVLDGGMGGAWSSPADRALSYALLEGSTRLNGALRRGYAAGAGVSAGSYVDMAETWRIHLYANVTRYFAGQQDNVLSLGLGQRVALNRDVAVRADIERKRELQKTVNAASVSLLVYF